MKKREMLEHTADLLIKVKADTLENLFEAAAEGILDNAYDEISFAGRSRMSLRVEADSAEEALVKFLNEILYLFYVKKRLLKGNFCRINFDGKVLSAEADFLKVKKFTAGFEIKAVTYGNVKIGKKDDLFETAVIADV